MLHVYYIKPQAAPKMTIGNAIRMVSWAHDVPTNCPTWSNNECRCMVEG